MNGWFSRQDSGVSQSKKKFKILSLDGGGVRAVLQPAILRRLYKEFPELLNECDLFVGTSAGSIVASGLAIGFSPKKMEEFWTSIVPKIFEESYSHELSSGFSSIGSKYSAEFLSENLSSVLGDKSLKDISKKILIPTFKVTPGDDKSPPKLWKPEYFHNFSNSNNSTTSIKDACLCSSAAPTYFPIHKIGDQGYVDGGVYANNPALLAVTTALTQGIKLEDIVVLSISTGTTNQFISGDVVAKNTSFGLAQWAPYLIDLLLDSGTECANRQCEELLKDNYLRIDPILTSNVGLDDVSVVPELKEIASKYDLDSAKNWLETHWCQRVFCETEQPSESEDLTSSVDADNLPDEWKCNIL